MSERSKSRRMGEFRHAVISGLLINPPASGENLKDRIKDLAAKIWIHPVTGEQTNLSYSTIESWYYLVRSQDKSPLEILQNKKRSDSGHSRALDAFLKKSICDLQKKYPKWSHKLHFDNLLICLEEEGFSGILPSYSTVRRYRISMGFERRYSKLREYPEFSSKFSIPTFVKREIKRYETSYVNSMWHCDIHHCSRSLLSPNGEWVKPKLVAIIDDHSRLICHLQWYWQETACTLIHSLMQAFLKCGLPQCLLSDNGAAMTAKETKEGLQRLGVLHETTLPYSPYQNGKQEVFFCQIEGRLLPMMEKFKELDLNTLNKATQAWLEEEYNSSVHSEIKSSPRKRFMESKNVGRTSPDMEKLEQSFCLEETRRVRKSDSTVTILGRRFDLPHRFTHLKKVSVRFASWAPNKVWLVSDNTILCRLWPENLEKKADGKRRILPNASANPNPKPEAGCPVNEFAPLLNKYMEKHENSGRPPAFIPLTKEDKDE